MRYTSIINMLIKVLFTCMVFVFINNSEDYIIQPLLNSIAYLLCGIIALYIIIYRWGITLRKPSIKGIYQTIKNSSDVFVNNLAPNLYNSLSKVLLGVYSIGGFANGILEAADKVTTIFHQFLLIISRTFFPFLARRIDKHGLYARLQIGITGCVCVCIFLFAPSIIRTLFADSFIDAVIPLRILTISMFFLSLSNVYGTNYLILVGEERSLRNITLVASIVGFFLSFILIRKFNYIGAVTVIAIARVLLGSWIALRAMKVKKTRAN